MENAPGMPTASNEVLTSSASSNNVVKTNSRWVVQICPATGGLFDVLVSPADRVDTIKSVIGQKLKIPKERINLLYRERLLCEGRLVDNGVSDGSRITLLPSVHAGLLSQKSEHPVVQALENLSEGQVNDFICGKSPLTLAMRLGDHMMFVQLQLSTTPPRGRRSSSSPAARPSTRSSPSHLPIPSSSSSTCSTPSSSPEASPCSPLTPSPSSTPLSSSGLPRFTFPPAPPSGPLDGPRHYATQPATAKHFESTSLADAKRSLSMKLREFSQTSSNHGKQDTCREAGPPSPQSGAIIESMEHLGGGVYSGTFSGTLNPRLQETDGKPKRSVNTIVHILNDLLGASPQYGRLTLGCKRPRAPRSDVTQPHDASAHKRQRIHEFERLNEENTVTRSKVERLQKMLEMRRRGRRMKPTHRNDAAYMESGCLGTEECRASDPEAKPGAVVS